MQFNSDGKFKIMQITDIQEKAKINPDTLKLISSALDAEVPDFVVVTGDQINGGSRCFTKGDSFANISNTIKPIFDAIIKRNIPFAVTFGNHDCECGISNKEQYEKIYLPMKGYTGIQAPSNLPGCSYIPIYSSDGNQIQFCLYLLDSGKGLKNGGYEAMNTTVIDWYRTTRDSIKDTNGRYIPSMVFQHIPLREYYNVLEKTTSADKSAIRAFRTHKGEFYKLGQTCGDNDVLLEPPSVPDTNSGEFEALSQYGDVKAVFVGHDHKNNFVGTYHNIDLAYTPSCGFNVYGNRTKRGIRCIVLDEHDTNNYQTYTRTFDELIGKKVTRPVFDYLTFMAPATFEDAVLMGIQSIICIICIVVIALVLAHFM